MRANINRCQAQNRRRTTVMFRATKDGLAGPEVSLPAHSEDPHAKENERVRILTSVPVVNKKQAEAKKYGSYGNAPKNKNKARIIQGNVPAISVDCVSATQGASITSGRTSIQIFNVPVIPDIVGEDLERTTQVRIG